MTEFILMTLVFLCIIAMIGENSNPRGMNIFWYKVGVKAREYWKALQQSIRDGSN